MEVNWAQKIRNRLKYYLDKLASNNFKVNMLQALPFWIASLLVGLVAVGYTRLFSFSEAILKDILLWHD